MLEINRRRFTTALLYASITALCAPVVCTTVLLSTCWGCYCWTKETAAEVLRAL